MGDKLIVGGIREMKDIQSTPDTRGIAIESDQQSTAARVIQLAPCPVLVVP